MYTYRYEGGRVLYNDNSQYVCIVEVYVSWCRWLDCMCGHLTYWPLGQEFVLATNTTDSIDLQDEYMPIQDHELYFAGKGE